MVRSAGAFPSCPSPAAGPLTGIWRRRRDVRSKSFGRKKGADHEGRAQKPKDEQIALFIEQAEAVAATTQRLADLDEVPKAVSDYLRGANLPSELKIAPHTDLTGLDWAEDTPSLTVTPGIAEEADQVALTRAFGGVAETGTLALASGPESPTTLNFLPENNIVVLRESDLFAAYEEVFDKLRATFGEGEMPRTLNFITGPSRTADIEQTIQLGAHGPRRLHILIVKDDG